MSKIVELDGKDIELVSLIVSEGRLNIVNVPESEIKNKEDASINLKKGVLSLIV